MTAPTEQERAAFEHIYAGSDFGRRESGSYFDDDLQTAWDAWLAAKEHARSQQPTVCLHIVTSKEGTSYCRLAEDGARDAERRGPYESTPSDWKPGPSGGSR